MPATPAPRLTAHERRVAEPAAGGCRTRDIARQCAVTRRAVELHLTRVHRKLSIPGRERLPEVLGVPG